MKNRARFFTFTKGLSTTTNGKLPDEFSTFQNVETDLGQLDVRKGRVRIGTITNSTQILDADGSDDTVPMGNIPLVPVSTTKWTFEILWTNDSVAASKYVIGRNGSSACGLKIQHTSTSTVVATITDTAANATTLTWTGIDADVTCGLQITRDGATLTGWLNGTVVTGSMSATNDTAAGTWNAFSDNGANFLNGGIDYIRIWNIVRTTRRDIYSRLLNSRHKNVLYDWVFTTDSIGDIIDRGSRGVHCVPTGTPAFTKNALCLNHANIQGIGYNVRNTGTRELVIQAGGLQKTMTIL